MSNPCIFLLIGCNDNGIHTETVTFTESISDACIAFAKRDTGPIKFMEVAEGLRDAGEINNGDLTILKVAKETSKIDIGELQRYQELIELVEDRISDLASLVFNFGQFASGDDYIGQDHNNYVDGDSVSQWKIYIIKPEAPLDATVVAFPTKANNSHIIKKEMNNERKETRHSMG